MLNTVEATIKTIHFLMNSLKTFRLRIYAYVLDWIADRIEQHIQTTVINNTCNVLTIIYIYLNFKISLEVLLMEILAIQNLLELLLISCQQETLDLLLII